MADHMGEALDGLAGLNRFIEEIHAERGGVDDDVIEQVHENAARIVGVAQVHATIALVEQVRIANQLKVAELDLTEEVADHTVGSVDFRIREYLSREDWALIEVPE